MKEVLASLLVLSAACDCYDSREGDAGGDGTVDDEAGAPDADGPDSAADADGSPDAGPDLRCWGDVCTAAARYCCAHSSSKLTERSCFERPTVLEQDTGVVNCFEIPVGSVSVFQDCGAQAPCPAERAWCCDTTWRDEEYRNCAQRPLWGWDCLDSSGVEAEQTWTITPEWMARCEEGEPCPDDRPFCCANLFCAPGVWVGWDCHEG